MAKLGTEKRPAILRVQSMTRANEVAATADKHGIKFIMGIEPDKPEDTSDLRRALGLNTTVCAGQKVGRNEPCPCGSGKKYKNCCQGRGNV
jgi:SWIM/SEC-C metal-binding protein